MRQKQGQVVYPLNQTSFSTYMQYTSVCANLTPLRVHTEKSKSGVTGYVHTYVSVSLSNALLVRSLNEKVLLLTGRYSEEEDPYVRIPVYVRTVKDRVYSARYRRELSSRLWSARPR